MPEKVETVEPDQIWTTFTLTTEDKQELLSRHLGSVEDLVKDLRNCAPFGGVVC